NSVGDCVGIVLASLGLCQTSGAWWPHQSAAEWRYDIITDELENRIPSVFLLDLPSTLRLARSHRQLCTQFYLSSFRFWAYIYSRSCWNSGRSSAT
ncbi:hypothetical protein EDB83DRAFT_2356261, partial [Lactarius deliciosus]